MFGKKKDFRIPKVFEVPAEKVREIIILSEDSSRLGRYELWKCIQEMFPETSKGSWKLSFDKATSVSVIEKYE